MIYDDNNAGVKPANSLNLNDFSDCLSIPKSPEKASILIAKSASSWLNECRGKPMPKMLFGEIFYEGYLLLLYGDTNTGKSLLSMEICNSIAMGKSNILEIETPAQKVIYCDFEMKSIFWAKRYTASDGRPYEFSDNLLRVELDHTKGVFDQNIILQEIENLVIETGAKVVCIDNLSYIFGGETEKRSNATPFMQQLQHLKTKHNLSILVICHTTKRSPEAPLTTSGIAGSKALADFSDGIFAVGESYNNPDQKYIIQLKGRSGIKPYGRENVILCNIEKKEGFLHFVRIGFADEKTLLKPKDSNRKSQQKEELAEKIFAIKKENPYISDRKIAEQLGLSNSTVSRVLSSNI